ncbi:hypothetical protein KA183_00270 [bacterium]|nr:hypothetical protein [bacterium]
MQKSSSSKGFDFVNIELPWHSDRISIYQYVVSRSVVSKDSNDLPDEPLWNFEHNVDISANFRQLRKKRQQDFKLLRVEALANFIQSPDSKTLYLLYMFLVQNSHEKDREEFLKEIDAQSLFDEELLYLLSIWLIKNAPDREAVLVAMLIAARYKKSDDAKIFLDLGMHPKFIRCAMTGIELCSKNIESDLWILAKSMTPTAFASIVCRLANTENEEIKRWFIREAPDHELYMECSFVCATKGNLLKELSVEEPDSVVLKNAYKLLTCMHGDETGESLDYYSDGPQAMLMLVRHLNKQKPTLKEVCRFFSIRRTVEQINPKSPYSKDWESVTEEILTTCDAVINRPDWEKKILSQIDSDSDEVSFYAESAAFYLKVDLWNQIYKRTKFGGDVYYDWQYLVQDQPLERIEKTIELAEEKIIQYPSYLEPVIKVLKKYPGTGRYLLLAALKCDNWSVRHGAVLTLCKWSADERGEEIQNRLMEMAKSEKKVFITDKLTEMLTSS